MALNRADILGAPDLDPVEVSVPEWGGTVFLRRFTAGEALKMEDATGIDLLVAAIMDEDGKPLFTAKDAEALQERSAAAVNRLLNEVLALNGMGTTEGN